MSIECEIGHSVHTAWCHPCRMAGFCLGIPVPKGAEDRSLPQAFKPSPPLTAAQQAAVDDLFEWYANLEKMGTMTTNHGIGSDADYIGVHPRTLWALWRRGWVRRSLMGERPARDKWMLTDAAWDYINRDSDGSGEVGQTA